MLVESVRTRYGDCMRKRLAMVVALAFLGFAGWKYPAMRTGLVGRLSGAWHQWRRAGEVAGQAAPVPDRARYDVMSADLERWRLKLQSQYRRAGTPGEKCAAERDARMVLETVLPELMKCWLGTPWDFNGTASGPGNQPIACGYFVSTVLKDAGFLLDRYRLAQQPSSRILTTFVAKRDCRLMVDVPYEKFAGDMKCMGSGVYLVGLDTHVAFLVVENGRSRLIHSSGAEPYCVVDEEVDHADVLKNSCWRMLANLTAETSALRKWLEHEPFAVKGG